MGKGSGKIEVTDYKMAVHFGIALGPVDELLGVYVGEKPAWEGSVSAETEIVVNQPELFGGPTKEGGVSGILRFLPGGPSQTLVEKLAAMLGLTTATAPGYRGISSFWAYGSSGDGFTWGANSPYLKTVWTKVRRRPPVLNPAHRVIGPDANPAHIIYECMVNTDWGASHAPSTIDTASFNAAAETLFNESFGLSMAWIQQAKVEDFVSDVLDHIQGTLFIDPQTGLQTLILLRADYDEDALPVFDETNCRVRNFQRKTWGETVNEIVVTWTNPVNEQEETVSLQDLANVTIQGGVVSDARPYYGVRNADLAMQLCARDLRAAAAPLATCTVEATRKAWNLVPGKCFKLFDPENNVNGAIFRVTSIDYGKTGDSTIKVSVVEDIFGFDISAYVSPPSTMWPGDAQDPRDMDFVHLTALPYYFATRTVDQPLDESETLVGVLAAQTGIDTYVYKLMSEQPLPGGGTIYEGAGNKAVVGRKLLASPLVAEASSTINLSGFTQGVSPREGIFAMIGFAGEADSVTEIVFLRTQGDPNWTVDRGMLDTTPKAWPAGTPIWIMDQDANWTDTSIWAAMSTVNYKLLPRTSTGILSPEDATVRTISPVDRPHLPLRPADVQVNGTGYGPLNLVGESYLTVSWANRNRLTEDSVVLPWEDPNEAPEAGQTTTLTFFDAGDVELFAVDGLTGTAHEMSHDDFGGASLVKMRVTSKRDGLESLQGHEIILQLEDGGYGLLYGFNYGGA